jgi:GT2 family glycosyltransferase
VTPHVAPGFDGAAEVTERGGRSARTARGVQAQDVGPESAGQLGRSTPDGAPRDEDDTLARAALPSVSVVVATRQRAHFLEALVHAVLSDPGALELIIVVDGLDDLDSVPLLQQLGDDHDRLRHLQTDRLGQNGALDQGVLAARGDIVLLLDDDVLPISPLATGHARRHAQRDDLVVVGFMPVRAVEGRRLGVASRIYADAYNGHCAALIRGDQSVLNSLWFGNVSLRRVQCREVGIRSSTFTSRYHSDRDFGYRLADVGLTGVFDESLRSVHLHSRSTEAFLRDARSQGEGLRRLHQVHPERLAPFSPDLLTPSAPRPLDAVFRVMVVSGVTRTLGSRALMRLGALAGLVHLSSVETFLVKVAQHIMQWHGAVVGEAA